MCPHNAREMQLRDSNLDQFVAEAKRYLPVYFAKLESLVFIFFCWVLAGIYFRIGRTMVIVPFLTANHQP